MATDTSCTICGVDSVSSKDHQRLCDRPSPFQHLLHLVPNSKEVQEARNGIKAYLTDLRQDLLQAQNRVQRLREALNEAEADEQSIIGLFNIHSSLNHPINQLPAEILAHIFSFTFKRPFALFETRAQGPWLLGKVCRQWRKVAWETPQLWDCFEVSSGGPVINSSAPDRQEHQAKILEEALERSGQTKLNVMFESYHRPQNLVEILTRHSSHIAELHLTGALLNFGAFKDGPQMPMLKYLDFMVDVQPMREDEDDDLDADEVTYDQDPYFDIATKAPELTRAKLSVGGDLPSPTTIQLPWSQLTSLELEFSGDNPASTLILLAQCSNLEWFKDDTHTVENDTLTPPPGGNLVLPHLKFLSTRCPFVALPYLTCPALETFELAGYLDEFPNADLKKWRQFAERSRFRLKEVRIAPEEIIAHITSPFLQFVDDIKYVSQLEVDLLDVEPPLDIILDALKLKDAKVVAFPQLQSLVLRLSVRTLIGRTSQNNAQEQTETGLIELIESRWRLPDGHAAKLKKVEIGCDSRMALFLEEEFDEDEFHIRQQVEIHRRLPATRLYKTLKILKEEGLEVSLVTGHDRIERL